MTWFTANWFWVVIFIAFIGMHLFGHGGHGGKAGHGGHGGASRRGSTDSDENDELPPRDTTTRGGGHQH